MEKDFKALSVGVIQFNSVLLGYCAGPDLCQYLVCPAEGCPILMIDHNMFEYLQSTSGIFNSSAGEC